MQDNIDTEVSLMGITKTEIDQFKAEAAEYAENVTREDVGGEPLLLGPLSEWDKHLLAVGYVAGQVSIAD